MQWYYRFVRTYRTARIDYEVAAQGNLHVATPTHRKANIERITITRHKGQPEGFGHRGNASSHELEWSELQALPCNRAMFHVMASLVKAFRMRDSSRNVEIRF